MLKINREQARTFILCRQGLLGRHRFSGKAGAYQYVRQAGCIQFDPVDVCGKNAELTLQSRVKGFQKQMLADLLYKDRLLVDYCDKELSIWPREDWPYFSNYRQASREHGARFPGIPALEERALACIRENGPVSSDTLPLEGTVYWHSSIHWSGHWEKESPAARSVLEQLYTDGTLLIHHKNGSRKFYDLAERYFPRSLLEAENPCQDEEALLRWRVKRRVGAVGLIWNRRSDAWLGIPMTNEAREAAFGALEAAGEIRPLEVEGIRGPLYMLAKDAELMENVLAGEADTKARLEFLAPLDPMLWDRKLIEALWGFKYSWEIYTPPAKRKFGYYVLPIVYGSRFAGRIEAAADRKNAVLRVKNVWFEDGAQKGKRFMNALDKTIARFAAFNGCEKAEKRKAA